MNDVVLFGNTDLAELVMFYNNLAKIKNIVAITVNKDFINDQKSFCGLPLIPFETMEEKFSPKNFDILVCVGYREMNKIRGQISEQILNKGYKITNYIDPLAKVYSEKIGYGNIFFPNSVVDPFCEVGNGNILYSYALLSHHSKIGNYNFLAVRTCVAGHVTIEHNCFLGANSTIKNGISIESRVLVGAGAYVYCDLNNDSVFVPQRGKVLKTKKSSDFTI